MDALYWDFSLAYEEYSLYGTKTSSDRIRQTLSKMKEACDLQKKNVEATVKDSKDIGLSISDTNQALNYYYNALLYYGVALDSLDKFYNNPTTENFATYLKHRATANGFVKDGIISVKGYLKYMELIENY